MTEGSAVDERILRSPGLPQNDTAFDQLVFSRALGCLRFLRKACQLADDAPKGMGPDDMIPGRISFHTANPKYRQFKNGDNILEYTLEGSEITVDWVIGKNASLMMESILDAEGANVTRISGYVTDKLGTASNAALQRLGNQLARQMGAGWKAAIETVRNRRYLVFTK